MTMSTNAPPPSSVAVENARILIVDDEDANLMVLRRMLERAGYTNLQTINDSSLVVERFVSFEPDLLVLDLHMPTPDGFEVMAQLEPLVAPDSYVPILVLTADITESTRERALAVGARDFLTKPFRYTELLLRINNLLETRALHSQLRRDKAILEARMREQQANDQARAERRRSASRRIEAVLASDRNGTNGDSGIGLQMVYQPILDLTTGEVLGAEALARFGTEPQRSPAQWFMEAAEVGLGIQLELAALRRASEGLPLLPPNAFLSVNASAETIRSPAMLSALDGLPTSRLVIELTEHERIEDYDALVAPVARLRSRGVRLAVDDAGAGFASLQHILRLSPDIIKLDRIFIEDLAEDPVKRALTTALVSFAGDIGATLVAEGIATGPELEALRSIGVRHGQGRFLGDAAPLPFDPDGFAHLGGAPDHARVTD
jgi:EAL domain-containing protein (putative c-di-GMP-specific phosphodiesterase class I)